MQHYKRKNLTKKYRISAVCRRFIRLQLSKIRSDILNHNKNIDTKMDSLYNQQIINKGNEEKSMQLNMSQRV